MTLYIIVPRAPGKYLICFTSDILIIIYLYPGKALLMLWYNATIPWYIALVCEADIILRFGEYIYYFCIAHFHSLFIEGFWLLKVTGECYIRSVFSIHTRVIHVFDSVIQSKNILTVCIILYAFITVFPVYIVKCINNRFYYSLQSKGFLMFPYYFCLC